MAYTSSTFTRPLLEKVDQPRAPRSESFNHNTCDACGGTGDLICCESCPCSYHLLCLDPPLSALPTTSWFCPSCVPPSSSWSSSIGTSTFGHILLRDLLSSTPVQFELPRVIYDELSEPGDPRKAVQGMHGKKTPRPSPLPCSSCGEKCRWKSETAMCHVCRKPYHIWCTQPPLLHAPLRPWACEEHVKVEAPVVETFILPQPTFLLDFESVPPQQQQQHRRKSAAPFRSVALEDDQQQQQQQDEELDVLAQAVSQVNDGVESVQKARRWQRHVDEDANGSYDPVDVMAEVLMERLQERSTKLSLSEPQIAKEIAEYVSKTNTVLSKARTLGIPLRTTGFTVEEAVLGSVPTMKELECITPEVMSRMDPLFVQFLAWQRMMQINVQRGAADGLDDPVNVAHAKDYEAAILLQREIDRLRKDQDVQKEALRKALARQRESEQWANGKKPRGEFLDALFGVALEHNLPLPDEEDQVLEHVEQRKQEMGVNSDAVAVVSSSNNSNNNSSIAAAAAAPTTASALPPPPPPPQPVTVAAVVSEEEEVVQEEQEEEEEEEQPREEPVAVVKPTRGQRKPRGSTTTTSVAATTRKTRGGDRRSKRFREEQAGKSDVAEDQPQQEAEAEQAQQPALKGAKTGSPSSGWRVVWKLAGSTKEMGRMLVEKGQVVNVGKSVDGVSDGERLDIDLRAIPQQKYVSKLHMKLRCNADTGELEVQVEGRNGITRPGGDAPQVFSPTDDKKWLPLMATFPNGEIDVCGCIVEAKRK